MSAGSDTRRQPPTLGVDVRRDGSGVELRLAVLAEDGVRASAVLPAAAASARVLGELYAKLGESLERLRPGGVAIAALDTGGGRAGPEVPLRMRVEGVVLAACGAAGLEPVLVSGATLRAAARGADGDAAPTRTPTAAAVDVLVRELHGIDGTHPCAKSAAVARVLRES